MAVIAAFELHDLACARCSRARGAAPTSSPRCPRTRAARARSRAAAGRSVSASSISISVGAPNERPFAAASCTASHDGRMRVAEDRRPPRADVVDVALAVGVPEVARPRRASKKRGVPPTERNARTGELTPAGIVRCARAKSSSLRIVIGFANKRADSRARARARCRGASNTRRSRRPQSAPAREQLRRVVQRDAADGDDAERRAARARANSASGARTRRASSARGRSCRTRRSRRPPRPPRARASRSS